MENYIVINGKKAELTEEQLKAFSIEVKKKRNNPFNSELKFGEKYYSTHIVDGIFSTSFEGEFDKDYIAAANSFNDKDFANQVYLHELLNRKLLKYAYENDAIATDWTDSDSRKYFISKNTDSNSLFIDWNYTFKQSCVVYFKNGGAANLALEDVIKPFMKEHPEFVW